MSPESSKDKKEAKANALTFSQDDGGDGEKCARVESARGRW